MRAIFAFGFVAAALIAAITPVHAESDCAADLRKAKAVFADLIDYWGADSDARAEAWSRVQRDFSSWDFGAVNPTDCDTQDNMQSVVAWDTYQVFALANGTNPQSKSNLDESLEGVLLTSPDVEQVPGYTTELYDWLLRRLVQMYKTNHFAFPDSLSTSYCGQIQAVVPDADCTS